ncbi:MAG: hypothetical protein AAF597_04500, partial [Bacteroidota bacterium]
QQQVTSPFNPIDFRSEEPVRIESNHEWESVHLGRNYVFAFEKDGMMWGWGDSEAGQLGIGDLAVIEDILEVCHDGYVAAFQNPILEDGKKIGLRASNGKFVCAEQNNNGKVVANRDRIGGWETFTVVYLGDGQVALKSSEGKYACSELNNGSVVTANRDRIGSWETFTIIDKGNKQIALQAVNGNLLRIDANDGYRLKADQSNPGSSALFTVEEKN